VGAARRYAELLRAHIDKENSVLFPLADAVLDDNAQRSLARDFDAVAEELGREASIRDTEAALEALATASRQKESAGYL
jgi:hemerythrin-like domain-containing protein